MPTEELLAVAATAEPDDGLLTEDTTEESDAQLALRAGREDIAKDYHIAQKKLLPRLVSMLSKRIFIQEEIVRNAQALLAVTPRWKRDHLLAQERAGRRNIGMLRSMAGKLKSLLATGGASPQHPSAIQRPHPLTDED